MTEKIDYLIYRARDGDKKAFSQLVSLYQNRIFTVVYGIIGNQEEAEDVTQEIFLKAYSALSSLKNEKAFYHWLLRIATNISINYKKRLNEKITLPFHFIEEIVDKRETPEEYLERQETAKQITQALTELSEEHRAVLTLREIQELSYEGIANILRIPIGTVKSRLNHARDKLRQAIKKDKE